jgi:two-component system sensor histidine kinase HydH
MKGNKKIHGWFGFPPWIILGSVVILVPILFFWAYENLAREKKITTDLLIERGAALIRSFEAATRTGLMGMHGEGFELSSLLHETALQPGIDYIAITDVEGTILDHSNPAKVGETIWKSVDVTRLSSEDQIEWRKVTGSEKKNTYEVFRRFLPENTRPRNQHHQMMSNSLNRLQARMSPSSPPNEYVIFVGLDMGPIERARGDDARHSVIMALILLLVGFAGLSSLFLAQAYRSAKTTLTRVKAFSDNVVENMPIGLLALDPEGKIASVNQTAESVLELESQKILGKDAGGLLPPQLIHLLSRINPEQKVLDVEIDCPVKSGKTVPLEVSVTSFKGEDEISPGHIILFRDLTEIKELKKEIETSQRLAALGKLAAGLAHEIRNPLSSIKGFATFFKEKLKDMPEFQSTAEVMVNEVERLNRVISELLEFARPMEISRKSVPIQTVIQHSLKMIENEAKSKNITITTNFSPEVTEANIDADRIHQVLLNLYLNAIQEMEEGGDLIIDLLRDTLSGNILITVSDTGGGIGKEDLVHVFDPYFTTKPAGTGLGLAIVHKIIESHKGEVKVESELGQGTKVSIILPQ